jgi:hypothetical protein
MAERKIIVNQLKLKYSGLFSFYELFRMVDHWFIEKGFDKFEKKNFEYVYPTGKQIEIEIEPWRKMTDYLRYVIKINFYLTNIREVEVVRDNTKMKLNQGSVEITFDGYLDQDYENRWEHKPIFVFLRTLFDHYVFKIHTEKYEQGIIDMVNQLHSDLKGFLNMYRYSDAPQTAAAPSTSQGVTFAEHIR